MVSKKDYFHYYGFGIIFLGLFYLFVSIFINNITKDKYKSNKILFFEDVNLLCKLKDRQFKCNISNGKNIISFKSKYSLKELRGSISKYSLNYNTFEANNMKIKMKYIKDQKCLIEWIKKDCLNSEDRKVMLKWKYEEVDLQTFSQLENL